LFLNSCIFNDDDENDKNSNYVFIEQHKSIHGDLISGQEPPLLQIDFPTYQFNNEIKSLNGVIDFDIDSKLKVIYGSGSCLSGTAGNGCATGLTGIYEIPFMRNNFELLKLEDDGTAIFIYDEEVHSLLAGEIWEEIETRFDTINNEEEISISEITTTNRITNFGSASKADIIAWEW